MIPQATPNPQHGLSRRRFLQTAAGVITLSVTGLREIPRAHAQRWSPTPGVATQRIDGRTKVTGGKIFARDFNARNLAVHGWPDTQWYAMYLRALTTTRAFEGVDLTLLPADAEPLKVILGSDLAAGQQNPPLSLNRDNIVDEAIMRSRRGPGQAPSQAPSQAPNQGPGKQADPTDLDHPAGMEFDLIVRPGNRPDFLGQATALLLFDTRAAWRKARALMQFEDAKYQNYGPDIGPNPDDPKIFEPQTHYVRYTDSSDPGGGFSYYGSNDADYRKESAEQAIRVANYLNTTPDLIKHDFACDMRAMDPMFMEPESGLIWYDKTLSKLNVLLGTQSPDGDVADIGSMYGEQGSRLKVEHVDLISCFPGGGFGGRDRSPFSLMLALCADFADGNAVKLEYDRFEQFRVGLKRHACETHGSLVVAPDQTIEAITMVLSFDGGGRKNLSPYVASLGALCAGGAYRVPKSDIFANAKHSENVSGGSQRGFGGPQAFFATETAIDEIAAQQGWDPLTFRARNVVSKGDTTVVGGPISQELRLTEMLEIAGNHPLWSERAKLKAQHESDRVAYGTGLAMSLQAYGTSGDGVVAAVMLNKDGTYEVQSDAIDMGNGSATTLGVVIGDILGANASTVEMGGYTLFGQIGLTANRSIGCVPDATWDDPKLTKKGVGSSSACLTGLHQVHAVQQTAHALFANTILPAARALWGEPDLVVQDTSWSNGLLMTEGKESLSLPVIAEFVYGQGLDKGVLGHGYCQEIWVNAMFNTQSGSYRFELDGLATFPSDGGAAKAVPRYATQAMDCSSGRASRYAWAPCVNVIGLTVDRITGEVQIEDVLSVLNAGRIHVEQLVSGQSQGGVAMAIGYSLLEDMPPGIAGPADGRWNLNRYHVPRFHDVPLSSKYQPGTRSQELVIMNETPGDKKQGRGIAEAVMCSVAPAISNALRDAVGVRYLSLPITPAKILKGLYQ